MISAEPKTAPRYSVYAPDPPRDAPPKADQPPRRPPGVTLVGGCGCFLALLLFLSTPLLAVAWWRLFLWADAHIPRLL